LATRFFAATGTEELGVDIIILLPVEVLEDILRTECCKARVCRQFLVNFHQNLFLGHTDLLLFFEIRELPAVNPSRT
jgi:hypothetical protein